MSKKNRIHLRMMLIILSVICCTSPASAGENNQWELLTAVPAPDAMQNAAFDPVEKRSYSASRRTKRGPLELIAANTDGKITNLGNISLVLSELLQWSWAFDPVNRELLAVGPGRKEADLGWTVVCAYNLKSGKWRRLTFGDEAARDAHISRLTALESLRALAGRTRAYWYRDNTNKGIEAERKDLIKFCTMLETVPELAKNSKGLKAYSALVKKQQLLDALKDLRKLVKQFESEVEQLAPIPSARLRSPAAADPENKVLVMFGGDHEDYLLNDTWLLDLKSRIWKRVDPGKAPSPRAGHSLAYLPGSKQIVMWDGYVQTNSRGYRSAQWKPVQNRGPWLYNVKKNQWQLLAPQGKPPRYLGFVNDYGAFVHTDLRTGPKDKIYVRIPGDPKKNKPDQYWSMTLNTSVAAGSGDMFVQPNTKQYRTGIFLASFCETSEPGKPVIPDQIPANTWTLLPASPRVIHSGQRLKDWSSAAWDPDQDQILHWGGGHCDGSYSAPAHWSPQSGRMCEGYDAEEQYGHQGGGISFIGRAKVPTHSYRSYAYDPVRKALVTVQGSRTYLYDTLRMDWNRRIDSKIPFITHCYTMILATTPHGVVSWAGRPGEYMGGPRGLWLLDKNDTWKQLVAPGKLPRTNVDGSAAVYDSKRDCLWFLTNGGYNKAGDGRPHRYDFKTGTVEALQPENIGLGKVGFFRETAYLDHCDWLLILATYRKNPKDKNSPAFNRVYDCANNRWMLVDHGPNTAKVTGVGQGIVYDGKRKLVYSIQRDGSVWVLRADPGTAKIIKPE